MVLSSVDEASSVLFGYDDVAGWLAAELGCLVGCGVLRETVHARSVVCDGCEEACLEDVEFLEGDGSRPARAYVVCQRRDDIGRVEVPTERLRQWVVDLNALAEVLGELLETEGRTEEIMHNRLSWLGRSRAGKRRLDFFLAVGAGRPDASAVFADARRIRECSTPLVLTPWMTSPNASFGAQAQTFSLAHLLTAEGSTLHIDRDEINETGGATGGTDAGCRTVPYAPRHHLGSGSH